MHRARYIQFLRLYHELDDAVPDDAVERRGYPADFAALFEQLALFMGFVFLNTTPRVLTDERISYPTLDSYRRSMLLWVGWVFERIHPNVRRPTEIDLNLHMRRAMVSCAMLTSALFRCSLANIVVQCLAFEEYGVKIRHRKSAKTGIGAEDLRYLLDFEMTHSYNVANSEQHQLVWCIARITACRPGALAKALDRETYLTFGDVRVLNHGGGKFSLNLKLWRIKERLAPGAAASTMEFMITAPNAENIIFSPAHRFLVLALRRGAVVDCETIVDVLNSNKQEIMVRVFDSRTLCSKLTPIRSSLPSPRRLYSPKVGLLALV
jgi:hypothetical protein